MVVLKLVMFILYFFIIGIVLKCFARFIGSNIFRFSQIFSYIKKIIRKTKKVE